MSYDNNDSWEDFELVIYVPDPKSKSNYSFGRGRAKRSEWSSLQSFELALRCEASSHKHENWPMGPKNGKVADRPVVCAAIYARTMVDTGNLNKSTLDAVEGCLYWTDASVRYVAEASERVPASKGHGLALAVSVHPPGTDSEDLLDESTRLMKKAIDLVRRRTPAAVPVLPPKCDV